MSKKPMLFMTLFMIFTLALWGCGGSSSGVDGDVAAGKALFAEPIIDVNPGCSTCHSLTPDQVLVGPSMASIGTRAETRIPGMSAEDYIRESILHPDNYVVEGFDPGVMVQVWEQTLTPEQVDSLVAYLLTLK
jgi:L-cysteine S-thiosulfotransferase